MSFPVSAVIDNFNRGNGGVGANWGAILAAGGSTLFINNNELADNTPPTNGQWTTDFGPDCETYITQTSTLFPFEPDQELPADSFVVYARLANMGAGTTDGYAIQINGDNQAFFFRYDNSSVTLLGATVDVSSYQGTGTKWGMSVVGDVISLYAKLPAGSWSAITTRTDATYTAAGRSGVALISYQNTVTLDDFGAGTIGGTPSTDVMLPMGMLGTSRV